MNMKLMTSGMMVAVGLSAFCGVQISNVTASQRNKDTGAVDISFDLRSDAEKVSVILSAMDTENNQPMTMRAIYDADGNYLGNPAKIEPSNGKHLVWNSALDLGKGFYSPSMVVTVRATESDLPLSRAEIQAITKQNCVKVRDEAEKAVAAAKTQLAIAKDTLAGVTDDVLEANLVQAEKATQYSQTNLVAFAAVSNMYGITQKRWSDYGGFPLVTDTFGPNQELTLATLNSRYYSIGNTTGATNKYNTAKVNLQTAEDAVSSNKYEILIKNADGTQVFNGPVYGSKAAAEKIALNYEEAYKRTIQVTAYTLDRSSKLYPWVLNPARTVTATDLTKQWIAGNSAKWASDDAAAQYKAQTAFNTAKDNLKSAQEALVSHYTARAEAYKDQVEAQNLWDNRKTLQSSATVAVQTAEQTLAAAQAELKKAQIVCDSMDL